MPDFGSASCSSAVWRISRKAATVCGPGVVAKLPIASAILQALVFLTIQLKRGGGHRSLTNLNQISVRIAHVAAHLGLVDFRFSNCAPPERHSS